VESSDEALAALAREGDEGAFRTLVARYRERLLAAASRRLPAALRGRVSSSDVVQDALVAAHRRIAAFEDRGEGSFGRWLAAILDNKVKDEVRDHLGRERRNANREVLLGSRPSAAPFLDKAPSPHARAQAKEQHAIVVEALASLSEDQQAVLRLVHEGGMTIAQAAEHLRRSPDAVRKLYARGVANLAEAVEARRSRAP
jgi:RNA polymerase sigma-70 factor (ECF subfamily)